MHTEDTNARTGGGDQGFAAALAGLTPREAGATTQVYHRVFATAEINSLSYWLEIFFSAGIATFDVVERSPAAIIGAMLISPLTAMPDLTLKANRVPPPKVVSGADARAGKR